jgi:hypothetical protein
MTLILKSLGLKADLNSHIVHRGGKKRIKDLINLYKNSKQTRRKEQFQYLESQRMNCSNLNPLNTAISRNKQMSAMETVLQLLGNFIEWHSEKAICFRTYRSLRMIMTCLKS